MKLTFLMENKTYREGIKAEHGLSVYIEAEDMNILFDAGATDAFISNALSLGVELESVEAAVVSHGHYDHTGGFPAFCGINKSAPVYIHKNAFRQSFSIEGEGKEKKLSGIRWSREERNAFEDRLVFTEGPLKLTDNIWITGTVGKDRDFVPSERFYWTDEEGNTIEDDMSHEQCLVIREKEGLYIFSGCSHRGVMAALKESQSMFPGERVAAFVCGMHLYSASDEDRERIVRETAAALRENGGGAVIPVHCTGTEALCSLKEALGEGCVILSAGNVYYGR